MEIKLPATLTAKFHEDGVWDPEVARHTRVPTVEIRFGDARVLTIEISDERVAHRLQFEENLNEYVADWLRHLWTMGAVR